MATGAHENLRTAGLRSIVAEYCTVLSLTWTALHFARNPAADIHILLDSVRTEDGKASRRLNFRASHST
jgi:hypothetical protein